MTEFAGSSLYVHWVYSGGTLVLNTDSRNFSYTPNVEYIDMSAYGSASGYAATGYKNGEVAMDTLARTDGTEIFTACAEGEAGTLIWGEAGTASNMPKVTLPALSRGVFRNAPYNDVVTYTLGFRQNGNREDGTW